MKRRSPALTALLLCFSCTLLAACHGPLAQHRRDQAQLEIRAAIDEYCDAYAARDMARAMACFAQEGELVCIGTGQDETRVGREQVRAQLLRDWGQSQSASIRIETQHLDCDGDRASAIGSCRFLYAVGGKAGESAGRYAIALRKERDRWRIIHFLAAVPAGDQSSGESFQAR